MIYWIFMVIINLQGYMKKKLKNLLNIKNISINPEKIFNLINEL